MNYAIWLIEFSWDESMGPAVLGKWNDILLFKKKSWIISYFRILVIVEYYFDQFRNAFFYQVY